MNRAPTSLEALAQVKIAPVTTDRQMFGRVTLTKVKVEDAPRLRETSSSLGSRDLMASSTCFTVYVALTKIRVRTIAITLFVSLIPYPLKTAPTSSADPKIVMSAIPATV